MRRVIADVNQAVAPDPITEPSYDIIIKQKFSQPT